MWADGCPGRMRPATVRCPATGSNGCRLDGTAAALLPQPRRSCPLIGVPVDTDRSAGRAADSGVSATRAASPVGVRTRALQRPSATAALRRRCPLWCPAAGRVDRWADTPTMTVPARRTCGAVGVRPGWPPRRRDRTADTAADTPGRFRRCRPGSGHLPTACCIPPWPVSGRGYRKRAPGRWPLVGCSQRRWTRPSRTVRRPRSWPRTYVIAGRVSERPPRRSGRRPAAR
jgi:hypothetical protein